jgi:hypothetical protein
MLALPPEKYYNHYSDLIRRSQMKITIEPTEDQSGRSADTMHSKVSISIASDDLDIGEAMEQVVKALQAWGFHNESIAGYLDEELAWQLGLGRRNDQATMLESIYPPEYADAISKDVIKSTWIPEVKLDKHKASDE